MYITTSYIAGYTRIGELSLQRNWDSNGERVYVGEAYASGSVGTVGLGPFCCTRG